MPPAMTGRFAPSPTGDLHLGGARTALAAWLSARAAGGAFVLRMEDLDRPRVVPWAAGRILEDLAALGLDWDEGPDRDGAHPAAFYRQSEAGPRYQEALRHLEAQGLIYPCYCSRAEIARAASAPHAGEEGPRYPGTCRELTRAQRAAREQEGRRPSLRVRVEPGEVRFVDAVHGPCRFDPHAETGDFVVRRADGLFAYQLAVVVDDAAMGVTEVVRGDDLLPSTARQILLLAALGHPPPRYAHLPLVLGPDGQRLSKRHGAVAARAVLEAGVAPGRLVALLLSTLLAPLPDGGPAIPAEASVMPRDLVGRFSLAQVVRAPTRVDPSALLASLR